jgi:hypothetical protein
MIWLFPNLSGIGWSVLFSFLFATAVSCYSIYFEESRLFNNKVTKKDEPVGYWIAVTIWLLLSGALLFCLLVPLCFDPNTLVTAWGSCKSR